jgi:hypothetical protein
MSKRVKVPALEAGIDQLDWAIKLFLDHQAFVPAITLAGAAEELLRNSLLADRGSLHSTIKTRIAASVAGVGLTEKKVSNWMNLARDHLKHGKPKPDGNDPAFDLEKEAFRMIYRAMENLMALKIAPTAQCARFIGWVQTNRAKPLIN